MNEWMERRIFFRDEKRSSQQQISFLRLFFLFVWGMKVGDFYLSSPWHARESGEDFSQFIHISNSIILPHKWMNGMAFRRCLSLFGGDLEHAIVDQSQIDEYEYVWCRQLRRDKSANLFAPYRCRRSRQPTQSRVSNRREYSTIIGNVMMNIANLSS